MTDVLPPIDTIDPVQEPKPRRKRPNGKELATLSEAPAPAPVTEGDAFLMMIERSARDPTVDVDKMLKLLDARERLAAQERERAFNEAMAATQAEMRPIAADADNPQTKSKYASYAALDRVLRPIYTKHGFAPSFNTLPEAPENHVRVVCDLTNCGHTRRYQIDMPADGKGAKGGDVMTKTHATGSAVSYGMRYLLKMIFNIAVGTEKDDDGNAASDINPAERITEAQLANLKALLLKTDAPAEQAQVIYQYFKVDDLSDLTPKQYAAIVGKLGKAVKGAQ